MDSARLPLPDPNESSLGPATLNLLCDPVTHETLELVTVQSPHRKPRQELVSIGSGRRFPIRDGIPVFLNHSDLSGLNKRYQTFYDRVAPVYDYATKLYALFRNGGERKRRMEYLRELEIEDGDKVLEVSIGTGANLRFLPSNVKFFGLDLSWGMLKQCRRKVRRWGLSVDLFQGRAEELPFVDDAFDVVFHMGGVNFFNDKSQGLHEIIRVAKAGTKILIVDETERLATLYEKFVNLGRPLSFQAKAIATLFRLVPQDVLGVEVKEICKGELFCLTFRKPPEKSRPK
jgi:ubiquinone/menaquinone biosynthesis C-methylase UbiE